ncbi:hypothetical protein U9M48_013624 [Paspalum notatum var. saurae]|uniref:Uncharacterized protein n=1 Tax=Paspalum notatum var. saurae TaxID=547442 RepID=A0AAQ3WJL0_PASNO
MADILVLNLFPFLGNDSVLLRIKLGGGYTKRYHTSSNPTPERKDFDIQPTTVVDRCKTLTMLGITWEANIKAISHPKSTSGTPQDQMSL